MNLTSKKHLFAGSYTGYEPGQLSWVGSKQPGEGILLFTFDSSNGALNPTGQVIKQDSPTWLEIHPNKHFLIATHELSAHTGIPAGVGYVSSYKILKDGGLKKICTQSTNGRGNTCATFDRTGRYLLVTRYWEGGISILPFNPDTGIIGEITVKLDYTGAGTTPLRQTMSHPHAIHGDPQTNMVYVMDLGVDKIHQHLLDITTGRLISKEDVKLTPGCGPRGINFHPSQRIAYINCELNGSTIICSIDDEKGLIPIQTVHCYPENFSAQNNPLNLGKADFWGAEACLSANGLYYYYICRVHQSIAVFTVGSTNGNLVLSSRCKLAANSNARNLTLDPSGKYLLVASQDADCIESFQIHPKTGALKLVFRGYAPCAADIAIL